MKRQCLLFACTDRPDTPLDRARQKASDYFGWLASLAQTDLSASSKLARQQLGWDPTGPDLLTDLRNMDYSVA